MVRVRVAVEGVVVVLALAAVLEATPLHAAVVVAVALEASSSSSSYSVLASSSSSSVLTASSASSVLASSAISSFAVVPASTLPVGERLDGGAAGVLVHESLEVRRERVFLPLDLESSIRVYVLSIFCGRNTWYAFQGVHVVYGRGRGLPDGGIVLFSRRQVALVLGRRSG